MEALWFVERAAAERGVETGGELLIVTAPADNKSLRALQRLGADEFLEALRGARVGLGLKPSRRR